MKKKADGTWYMEVVVLQSAHLEQDAIYDDAMRSKCHEVKLEAVAAGKKNGDVFDLYMAVRHAPGCVRRRRCRERTRNNVALRCVSWSQVNEEGTMIDVKMEISKESAGRVEVMVKK